MSKEAGRDGKTYRIIIHLKFFMERQSKRKREDAVENISAFLVYIKETNLSLYIQIKINWQLRSEKIRVRIGRYK